MPAFRSNTVLCGIHAGVQYAASLLFLVSSNHFSSSCNQHARQFDKARNLPSNQQEYADFVDAAVEAAGHKLGSCNGIF